MKSSVNLRHLTRCIAASLIAGLLLIACIGLIQAVERPLTLRAEPQGDATDDSPPSALAKPAAVSGRWSPLSRAVKLQATQRDGRHPATDTSATLSTSTTGWFTFTVPWDDASDTPLSAADLLVDYPGQDPATVIDARGHVRAGPDGYFYFENTGRHARFWGTNLTAGASFPPCPDYPPDSDEFPGEFNDVHAAEKLAARLAKLGFNAARLHGIDLYSRPRGIWQDRWLNTQEDVVQDKDGVWHIRAGARVRVRLTMVADNRRYHVALVDPLPAGLEADFAASSKIGVNPALAVSGSTPQDPGSPDYRYGWWWWGTWYEHQNLRDERAEAFTSLLWDGVYEYTYVARATTPGTFVVPPAKAEEMYSPEVFGRGSSDVVIVR